MIHYNSFHRPSWSEAARGRLNYQIYSINNGWCTIQETREYISTMHPIIRNRMAKRFGRMMRAGKVHEDMELVQARKDFEEAMKWI